MFLRLRRHRPDRASGRTLAVDAGFHAGCALCFAMLAVVGRAQETTPLNARAAVMHAVYPGGTTTELGRRLDGLLATPEASRAHWGIAVMALDGTPLYGLDEGKLFRPASNAKLFTTAAAMALLGPETRVTTVVSATATPDADGVVRGDLVLHGAGDANLSGQHIPYEEPGARRARVARETAASKRTEASIAEPRVPPELVPMEDLAAQIAAAGVKSLTGALRGDADLWRGPAYPDTWDAGDAVWGYGAAVSALEFNDGQMELHVTPGARAGEPAGVQIVPDVGSFGRPVNEVTTVAGTAGAGITIVTRTFPASNVLRGAVTVGHPDVEEIAAKDPTLFATNALEARLLAHGILGGTGTQTHPAPPASVESATAQMRQPVDLSPRPEAETSPVCGRDFDCGVVVVARRVSPTLAEDVTVTLKESQNLHAEMLLRRLGRAYGSEGSFVQGARVVRQWLVNAGLDGDDFIFYDGSGLSSHDLVTPRTTAELLLFATRQPWFARWKAALPIGGVDGTLEHRFTEAPLKGNVHAKTGTLGESRALAGYLRCASGREVIFAVMVDNHLPAGSTDRATMDRLVAAIAAVE